MMGYFALTYTLHIHQSLNEIEKLQKSLQKGGWSLTVAWAAGPATNLGQERAAKLQKVISRKTGN